MENDGLGSKQVGSQASRRVNRRLAWIQPVCISINEVPALKGLMDNTILNNGQTHLYVVGIDRANTKCYLFHCLTKLYGVTIHLNSINENI